MIALQVTEIVRRLDQGMTRPFLVRAENDALYVAKGRETTQRGLIAEWICAHLAKALGLSIPEFTLLDVPQELAEAMGAEGSALGAGLVFGSRQETGVQEFAITQLKLIGTDEQRRLLAFDWWVENADRSLTPHGGNPNLLWRAAEHQLLVIDHNLAFDEAFDEAAFFATHVFREERNALFGDLVCQVEFSAWLEAALCCFDSAVSSLPEAWRWVDVARTLPVQVDLEAIKSRLATRTGLSGGSPP
jgi:hypothetical protein